MNKIIIQADILDRVSHEKTSGFSTVKTKREYNKVLSKVYEAVRENPKVTVTLMIREGNN